MAAESPPPKSVSRSLSRDFAEALQRSPVPSPSPSSASGSSAKTPVKFFSLKYLFGHGSEREAKKAVEERSPQQQLQLAEAIVGPSYSFD